MIVVGVDNGLDGAAVALDECMRLLWVLDCPTLAGTGTRRLYAANEMARPFRDLDRDRTVGARVFVESAQAMPKQGVSSTFSTGYGHGLWVGICAALQLPYEIVRPRTWQQAMLRDVPGEGKDRALLKAEQLFPDLVLTKPRGTKPVLHGRADAALIAAYGVRVLTGREVAA